MSIWIIYNNVEQLKELLDIEDFRSVSDDLSSAMISGATSGEILGAINKVLVEFRDSHPACKADTMKLVSVIIDQISDAFLVP